MRIEINRITEEGIALFEDLNPEDLDLNTADLKFTFPLKIEAHAFKIKNAVSVELDFKSSFCMSCSRCLKEIEFPLKGHIKLNYMVLPQQKFIDLDSDIREEIILNYPLKPLCCPQCLGLCPKCGKDLNEGKCNCNH